MHKWPLPALIGATVVLRLIADQAFAQPVVSDAREYLQMVRSLADGGPMRDTFGSGAFYSAGYPLLLAPAFVVAGAFPAVALAVNALLAGITALLVHALAFRLTGSRAVAIVAAAVYAVWLPGLLGAVTLAKENLSLPLLLGFVLASLAVLDGRRRVAAAVVAGLCYGAGLLTGASTLFIVAAFALVLWFVRGRQAVTATVAFALGSAAVMGPWLVHTHALLGAPVLTTNGGFNLYLGNNPAATGRFVSIADTPAGPGWQALRETLGEKGSTDVLGRAARAYALAHPMQTATLGAVKLGLFWLPNVPDAADDATGFVAALRWADVVQHMLILGLALAGVWTLRANQALPVILVTVAAVWAIHAATYVMPRYREPVMPLMIVLAAASLLPVTRRWSRP